MIIINPQGKIIIINQKDKAKVPEIIEENNSQEEIARVEQKKITQIMITLPQVDRKEISIAAKLKNSMKLLTIDYYEN